MAVLVGKSAVVIMWIIGIALVIAIVGAMLEAMFGKWEVTYLHTGTAGRHSLVSTTGEPRAYKTGRHRPEYVANHRASSWLVDRYAGMVTA